MKNYFLAPRSGEKSHKNAKSTIKNGIPLEQILPFLMAEEIFTLAEEDIIYAWGNRQGTKSAWDKMNTGDIVVFYSKGTLVMTGEVYLKKHSPEMALSMWPPDDKGQPWEYTFFLKNLKYISIPIKVFNGTVGYKSNYIVQGFTHLKDEKVQRIVDQYGSFEAMFEIFVDKNSEEIPSMTDSLYINLSQRISPLIIRDQGLAPKIDYKRSYEKSTANKKIDYVLRNKRNSLTGSKGEEIVLKIEKEALEKAGQGILANKVARVSIDDDTLGYDILSYDLTGKEKYIEVKSSVTENNLIKFFVSLNEYLMGKEKENYFIYFVEDVDSNHPKVTMISDPMDPSKFTIKPEGYIFEAKRVIKMEEESLKNVE